MCPYRSSFDSKRRFFFKGGGGRYTHTGGKLPKPAGSGHEYDLNAKDLYIYILPGTEQGATTVPPIKRVVKRQQVQTHILYKRAYKMCI